MCGSSIAVQTVMFNSKPVLFKNINSVFIVLEIPGKYLHLFGSLVNFTLILWRYGFIDLHLPVETVLLGRGKNVL